MKKARLDQLLVLRGLADSRERARALIRSGQVVVDDRPGDKPGHRYPLDVDLRVRERLAYVSRGGLKLEAALDIFELDVRGMVVADVGASTGGFTDCLLQRGAQRVYAIDVGYGQLAWKLRQDPSVVVMERTNVRYLDALPEMVNLATIDVSFIGLELVLPVVRGWLTELGSIIALVKPQFEAGRRQVGKRGIVRDPEVHHEVLSRLLAWAADHHMCSLGLIASPDAGPQKNVEFLWHLSPCTHPQASTALAALVDAAVDADRSQDLPPDEAA